MTQILFDRGTICLVPSLGTDALCLLLSPARGVARGRPEYQVIPLYASLPSAPTEADAIIEARESSLGRPLFAALWNVRPVLGSDLGDAVGLITRDAVLSDVRDALLRLADASIPVAADRVGSRLADRSTKKWRAAEIRRWQPLSGRVLDPAANPHAALPAAHSTVYSGESHIRPEAWVIEQWKLSAQIDNTEMNIGPESVVMSGPGIIKLQVTDLGHVTVASVAAISASTLDALLIRGQREAIHRQRVRPRDATRISTDLPQGTASLT